jgi:hydrogenase nickel incorporation protein HypB
MHEIGKIEVGEDIIELNRRLGEKNRELLRQTRTKAINVMGAIGSGKTSLIEYAVKKLREEYRIAAVAGDVIADFDADRFKKLDIPVVPMNTGKECHLDAHLMEHALNNLDLNNIDLIFVENVGNLICPSDFYLGENRRVIVVSVTEGDDIVAKHPVIFKGGDLAIVNKVDIAQFVNADPDKMIRDALRNIPRAFKTSIKTGDGLDLWIDFIRETMRESF